MLETHFKSKTGTRSSVGEIRRATGVVTSCRRDDESDNCGSRTITVMEAALDLYVAAFVADTNIGLEQPLTFLVQMPKSVATSSENENVMASLNEFISEND